MAAKDLHCGTPAPLRPAVIRCAIYTRKSTEEGLEQEFNTLDAQFQQHAAGSMPTGSR